MDSERIADYGLCVLLFDGGDEEALAQAREQWKALKAAGHAVTYWQQDDSGRWGQKACAPAASELHRKPPRADARELQVGFAEEDEQPRRHDDGHADPDFEAGVHLPDTQRHKPPPEATWV